jgi:CheY-like chemotaxis protein
LSVINGILDFSKIEAGKLEIDRAVFDLSAAMSDNVNIMQIMAEKKGLVLSCELPADIPSLFVGDSTRLRQVLFNLIGNAIKFTKQGQIKVAVGVERINGNRADLEFTVSDTGIGIPAEKQKIIFEAFSQADASTTRRFGGTGLGLTICSRIVKLMGGNIWVESEVDKGSTFHFTVAMEIADCANAEPAEPVHAHSGMPPTGKLKVLLVEDNSVNQKLAVRLLEKIGHEVIVADNGIQALNRRRNQQFDLILMDVQMPEMDGLAAAAAIRAFEKAEAGTAGRVPIIAMTAHAMKGDRERCLEAGMDEYIAKPVSAGALLEAIRKVLH